MLYIKLVFILSCALLATQALPASGEDDNELAKQLKKLIIDVTGFLDKLDVELEKLIAIVNKEGLDNFQKKTVSVTLKVLQAVKKFIDKELDKMQPEINSDAKKVSKCLEDDGNDIINLIVSYYNSTSICWNPSLKPFLLSFGPLITDLQKLDKDIAAAAPQLDNCKNDVCVFGVAIKILKQLRQIVDIFKKYEAEIKKDGKAFFDAAIKCAKTTAEPWRKESYKVFNEVATCVRK